MIRLVQVGLGGWGLNWTTAVLQGFEGVDVVAYVDSSPVALDAAQSRLGIPAARCFPDLDSALAVAEADAVLVTTALPGHVPVAQRALESGKHVLLEKPFAYTLAEAQQVVELAAARDRILMVSQNYRFYPAVRLVAQLIREGTFGAVGAVSVDFRRYANRSPREGHRHYTLRQPLLTDMAIHHFDLMRSVLGQEATEIGCRAWNPPWSNFDDPAAAYATIVFDGGTHVSYRGSWVSPGPKTLWAGEWRMECAEAEITWTSRGDDSNHIQDRVSVRPLGKRAHRVELPQLQYVDRAGAVAAFVEAIKNGTQPESSGRDNLGSVALMNAAVEAATTGVRLRVPGVLRAVEAAMS